MPQEVKKTTVWGQLKIRQLQHTDTDQAETTGWLAMAHHERQKMAAWPPVRATAWDSHFHNPTYMVYIPSALLQLT